MTVVASIHIEPELPDFSKVLNVLEAKRMLELVSSDKDTVIHHI